jgi:hypothetical protein
MTPSASQSPDRSVLGGLTLTGLGVFLAAALLLVLDGATARSTVPAAASTE